MSARRTISLGLGLCCLAAAAHAKTIYVNGTTGDDAWDGLCESWAGGTCGPKKTIQAGINVAATGDTVLVADGTYTGPGNRDLDFGGKAIVVSSEHGPETCVLDCEEGGRGFYFHQGESSASVVDGFTITRGRAYDGAGIYCSSSSPTIRHCVISACTANHNGGGLGTNGSAVTIESCTIADNTAEYAGGGMVFNYGAPRVINCLIRGNHSVCDFY